LLIVETALCRASELDDDFLAAAQSIFRNLRSSRAPATAPAPSVALPPGTSSPKKGLMWLRGLLSHDLPLISADRSGSCASLQDLLDQCPPPVHMASTQSTPPVHWYPDRTTRPRRRWSRL
jgi:hypothetical protein